VSNLASTPDRLQGALRRVNAALNPRQVFAMVWEYAVIVAKPGPPVTIDCAAVDTETTAHLPAQLTGLVLWPGPSGFVAQPPPGSIVRVAFINGDPSKPTVVGLDPNATPLLVFGFVTATMQLGDQTATPLAKATPLVSFLTALQAWSVAVSGALSTAGFPIAPAQAALVSAIATAQTATPTVKVLGT
jgi:hypothetical protein